ncbi:MAG: NADH-quinone oxidoreductase subunit C [Bacteroidales bacterium]
MTAEAILEALKGSVPDVRAEIVSAVDQPTLLIPREQVIAVLTALREQPSLQFVHLVELTAVDWWPGEPRFQVVYHLTSIAHRMRVRLKVPLAGEDAHLPTASGLWPGANWLEREVFDMFGIVFDGHPDLRRVLMPEDWEGHPQRKDYPVQIKMPVKVYEPLQISTADFQKNIEDDRRARESR